MGWLTHTLHQVGESLPLVVHRMLVKRDFIVVNYHMVSNQKLAHVAHLFPYKTPDMFEHDLEYLQDNLHLVSYDQVAEHLSGTKRLPSKSAALTYDDGLAECYDVVRPLLLKRGIPCTFFVSTNYIDNQYMANEQKASLCLQQIISMDEKAIAQINQALQQSFGYMMTGKQELITLVKSTGIHDKALIEYLGSMLGVNFDEYLLERTPYLTAAQIQALNAEGFSIGSHGMEHVKFSGLTDAQIEEAMADSCFEISKLTGRQSIPFAFPHNADGVSRPLLRRILDNNRHIGLLFDANGIRQEEDFLISRLNGDVPHGGEERKSNLSVNIKRAYIEEIANRYR